MPRDNLRLREILDACDAIRRYIATMTEEQFVESEVTRDAVLMRLIVIGEAAGQVSTETRARAPDIPWREIVGFRNRTVHDYFGVNWRTLWRTATINAPSLASQVDGFMATIDPIGEQ